MKPISAIFATSSVSKRLVAVVLAGARGDLVVGEIARGLLDQALLVREFEVDHGVGGAGFSMIDVRDARGWELEKARDRSWRSVLKPLGGGTRYEVFLVWDDKLFSLAVAKVLRAGLRRRTSARCASWARRPRRWSALAHPVLVRGFDAVLEGAHPHLLIEHLEGPTLRRLMRRGGALPLEQLLPLAAHVAAALHYMAAEGWVHLDVKPDNIVMGVPPRLIDLSIARTARARRRSAARSGPTPTWRPSSASRATGEIAPTDVWGLGATPLPRGLGHEAVPGRDADALPPAHGGARVPLGDDVPGRPARADRGDAGVRAGRAAHRRRGGDGARAARGRASAQAGVRRAGHPAAAERDFSRGSLCCRQ